MGSRSAPLHRVSERLRLGRDLLLSSGWLSQTPAEFREALLGIGIWKSAEPGDVVLHAGDTEGGLAGIALGSVEVSVDAGHPEMRFIHLAHAGFWAGYRPLLGKARNVTMTARTAVLWVLIPQRAVSRLLAEQPEYWAGIAQMADTAYEIALEAMVDLTRHSGRARVAATLLRLAGCRTLDPPPGSVAEIRMAQAELAGLAVMSRNTLHGYLADLAQCGLIEIGYREIRLTDPGRLRALLEAEE